MSKGIIFRNKDNEKIYPCPFYPIGSIYISTSSTDPSTYFGGKWERYAKGRVIVGIDESQSEFNSSGKIGGSKALQSHTHNYISGRWYWGEREGGGDIVSSQSETSYRFTRTTESAGTGNSGNLQPYISCYIWRRIS